MLGFGGLGVGLGVSGVGFRVQGLGFGGLGVGLRVSGVGSRFFLG